MDVDKLNDFKLAKQIAGGDKNAFDSFMQRHLSVVYQFVRKYRMQDADDICQEVFFKFWQYAPKLTFTDVSPKSWLFKVAYNLCLDKLKSKQNKLTDSLEGDTQAQEYVDFGHEARLINEQLNQNKIALLDQLPERQRTAITLTVYHGLSNKEVAEILEVSVDALESLLARGRKK
ncbi:MAG: RNA polymerase sigma factor, partial [Gammaproteobacteria bacterium]|nr:RNA polymerase sigma factor [Gammaproteobacteria bacterium]